jgi:secondary thiamine-phosphate synthase enzyme
MIQTYHITLSEFKRGFHLITDIVLKHVGKLPDSGILHVFIKHTSAGLTINENADPTVRQDFESVFNHLVKENEPYYKHDTEGSDDMPSHIKSSLVGSSVMIPVVNGKPDLGIWQGIYLCEFRNRGGRRELTVSVWS